MILAPLNRRSPSSSSRGSATPSWWRATGWRRHSLNAIMHDFRDPWMERMLAREVRIIDTQIMASLQNGTAFFASTSLLAVGGSLTLLRAADDVLRVFADLPLGIATHARGCGS